MYLLPTGNGNTHYSSKKHTKKDTLGGMDQIDVARCQNHRKRRIVAAVIFIGCVALAGCSPESQKVVSDTAGQAVFAAGPRAAQELALKAADGDLTALRDLRYSAGDLAPGSATDAATPTTTKPPQLSAYAQAELAYLYERGLAGLARNPKLALKLYLDASKKVSVAAYNAGLLMYFGEVVPQRVNGSAEAPGAAQLFQRAIDTKTDSAIPHAGVKLGEMYEAGIPIAGIKQDLQEALKYYDRAAQFKDGYAMMKRGKVLLALTKKDVLDPNIIEPNIPARQSFEAAARLWSAEAQYLLGWMYATGNGVEKPDTTLAAQWFIVCASRDQACRERSEVFMAGLTLPQRKAAAESAQIWLRSNQRMPNPPNYNQTLRSTELR